jgi:hypothetical protein
MTIAYSSDLKLSLIATGTEAGVWGSITNTNLVLIQQAIAGYENISIAGGAQTTTLVMTQSALATARNVVIKLTGTITGNQIVTVPDGIEKTWIVSNGTTGAFTVQFKYAGTGTGQTWSTTDKGIKILYADGSDIQVADLSTLSGSIVAAQITNSTITQAKLAANSVGTNQLQTNAVTAIKITQSTITQSKLAADSVGSNQLIATGVTPATYTAATITVDADGRITSASSGAAGGGDYLMTFYQSPATFTANPATKALKVTVLGGGGGSNPRNQPGDGPQGGGGGGLAVEYLDSPAITGPVAVTVGAGGAGTGSPGGTGQTGGTSSFGPFLSATGGQGGNSGSSGGAAGVGSGGTYNLTGQSGGTKSVLTKESTGGAGAGGFGFTQYQTSTGANNGIAGGNYGSGATAASSSGGPYVPAAPISGSGGFVMVEEFF